MEELKKKQSESRETETSDTSKDTVAETATEADTKMPEQSEVPAETKSEAAQESTSTTTKKAGIPKLYIGFAVTIAILLILGVMNHTGMLAEQKTQVFNLLNAHRAIATINGEKITHDEYQTSILEITQNATLQGADVTNETVKQQIAEQALTALINTELLLQNAHEAGYTATPEQIEAEYTALTEQIGGTELLAEKLAELELTDEVLRENIAEQVIITQYIDAEIETANLEVSAEDIASFYEEIGGADADVPPLEEIKPFLEEQLLITKQQEFIETLLETLHDAADIDIKI